MASKVCQVCRKSKPVSEFYLDTSSKDGRNRKCKPCIREYNRNYAKGYTPKESVRGTRGQTDLRILLSIKKVDGKLEDKMSEAKLIIKAYVTAYRSGTPLDEALKSFKIDRSVQYVRYTINELKEAAKNNMSLEKYFRAGRPFKKMTGPAKVLITRKK